MDIVLDVTHMEFDEHGVHGFAWPLARKEVVAVRDALLPPLVAAARGFANTDGEDAELLSTVFNHFVLEAMALYQAHALCRRFAAMGHCAIVPAQYRLLPALTAGVMPPSSPFLESLVTGPPCPLRGLAPPVLRRMWRFMRFVYWNGLSPRGLFPIDLERDIVATQASPLISRHARAVCDIVKYSSVRDWFASLDKRSGMDASQDASTATIDAAIEAINGGFASGGEELPDLLADYLRGWLAKASDLVQTHFNSLFRRPSRLPRRLWTGTGGNIWSRILRHATRRSGGMVIGHDHATGSGHLVSANKTLVEFESCDVFVTFNKTQATALKEGLRRDLLILPQAPDIIAVPGCRETSAFTRDRGLGRLVSRPRSQPLKIQTLMYPSTLYDGERMHLTPLMPDPIAVDWQARLLGNLSTWRYQVLHKPHPEGQARPPARFIEQFGVRILTERFERVMHLADAFIFDFSQSTTFGIALASGKPMVLVDFGLVVFTKEARAMLERRCKVVQGWFDKTNRAQVNWEELRKAIEESRDLRDTSFVETYLEY